MTPREALLDRIEIAIRQTESCTTMMSAEAVLAAIEAHATIVPHDAESPNTLRDAVMELRQTTHEHGISMPGVEEFQREERGDQNAGITWDGKAPAGSKYGSYHWLASKESAGSSDVAEWCDHDGNGSGLIWYINGTAIGKNHAMELYTYIGPALTPTEMVAALVAARIEGAQDMRERAARLAEKAALWSEKGNFIDMANAIREIPDILPQSSACRDGSESHGTPGR